MDGSSSVSPFVPISFTHPIALKLDNDNFLIWRKQVLATIRGFRLQHFLSASTVSPLLYRSRDDEANGIINPEYLDWEQQDQLIMYSLLALMSNKVLSRMVY